jgi:hypothetical protein
MIAEYMKRLQRILGDTLLERFNTYDLLEHINSARLFIATEAECCRTLVPSTAGVGSILLTSGGSGYTSAPTVNITPPNNGTQATAQAVISGGAVVYVLVTNPGAGYSAPTLPGITFSGGGGSGAAATVALQPYAQTVIGQEVYNFQAFNPLLQGLGQGFDEILAINAISVSWGSMKPTLGRLEWGDYQARLRAYNVGAQGFPRVWSQLSRGTRGSFYLWPIPYQVAQMDLEVVASPTPLSLALPDSTQIEAIPKPWTLAVPYKAAETAVLGEADLVGLADGYEKKYRVRMDLASATGQVFIPSYY